MEFYREELGSIRCDHELLCQISIRENQNCGTKLRLGNDIVVWLIEVELMGFWMKNERRSQDHIRRELYRETIWQWHPLTCVSPVEYAVERNNLNHHSTTRIETRWRKTLIVKHGKSSQTGMMYRAPPKNWPQPKIISTNELNQYALDRMV